MATLALAVCAVSMLYVFKARNVDMRRFCVALMLMHPPSPPPPLPPFVLTLFFFFFFGARRVIPCFFFSFSPLPPPPPPPIRSIAHQSYLFNIYCIYRIYNIFHKSRKHKLCQAQVLSRRPVSVRTRGRYITRKSVKI
jgi:hypothetical protein